MNDKVNHPGHYTAGGIECIDALKAAVTGLEGIEAVCTANAIKYLWRWRRKNGVEDLRKAIWYIEKLIREVQNPNVVFSDEGLGYDEDRGCDGCAHYADGDEYQHPCVACKMTVSPDTPEYKKRPYYYKPTEGDHES